MSYPKWISHIISNNNNNLGFNITSIKEEIYSNLMGMNKDAIGSDGLTTISFQKY